MSSRLLALSVSCVTLLGSVAGCGGGGGGGGSKASAAGATRAQVVTHYADLLLANYSDSKAYAEELRGAIETFLADPTSDNFAAAKLAWLAARPTYQESEVGRFYDGPIDNPTDGPEILINAWPLDEAYIDYVEGNPTAGLINDPVAFPDVTAEAITAANVAGGEANVATGWHAIEFLLWGQDRSDTGPGERSYLDYVDAGGTAPSGNEDRRRAYLSVVANLLVENLDQVVQAWSTGKPGNFRERFLALSTTESLSAILTGLGILSNGELRGQRLLAAFVNKDQEDEHSCFSDNTHIDHLHDELGIQNVFLGRYRRKDGTTLEGPGLDDLLVALKKGALATSTESAMASAVSAIESIPEPFDQAILAPEGSPADAAIRAALAALASQTDQLAQVAKALKVGISTTLE